MENENNNMENENMDNQEMQSGDNHKLPKNIIILGGLVVIAVVIALVLVLSGSDSTDEEGEDNGTDESSEETTVDGALSVVVVDVTDEGYPSEEINALVGTDIRISNLSSSEIHPAARNGEYEGFDSVSPIAPGEAWEFTFRQGGEFEMYDKLDDSVSVQVYVDVQ